MSVMKKLLDIYVKRKQKQIDRILNTPIEVMDEKLQVILKKHRDTVLGKRYD